MQFNDLNEPSPDEAIPRSDPGDGDESSEDSTTAPDKPRGQVGQKNPESKKESLPSKTEEVYRGEGPTDSPAADPDSDEEDE